MSITERREAVRFLVTRCVSVQRAGVLVLLQRATFRYQPRPVANDGVAAERRALAQAQPRYWSIDGVTVWHANHRDYAVAAHALWKSLNSQHKA